MVFAMTSAFSWQNSISLCPASFHTPRPNCLEDASVQFSRSVMYDSLWPPWIAACQASRAIIGSTNSSSGYISKENERGYQRYIHTPMFIVALFTRAKIWQQPKCPLMDEWMQWNLTQAWEREMLSWLPKPSFAWVPCDVAQHRWTLRTLC